ncbi:cytochrome P450 [Pararhodobacter zhoushanensis]|uniref:Cytochrome P450 n=1 Tax=Pararhodobacter zhoushanensis TaxID=2479545 RepID=A0ABT3H3X1_9RHOB|nr:cytochrome P450 [Pararhodobacter zhoushanensis]MCW1934504.1 cytochrome P450 [Pararhodobacter zhoushanensis]
MLSHPAATVDHVMSRSLEREIERQKEIDPALVMILRGAGRSHRLPNDAERRSVMTLTKRLAEQVPHLDVAGFLRDRLGGPEPVEVTAGLVQPLIGRWRATAFGLDEALANATDARLAQTIYDVEALGFSEMSRVQPSAAAAVALLEQLGVENSTCADVPALHWVVAAFLALIGQTHLIVNMMCNLAETPALQERLRAQPALRTPYLLEVERLLGSLRYVWRQTGLQPLDLGDVTLPPRSVVLVDLVSANRDPAIWDAPDALRLDRPRAVTASFAFGPLGCTGALASRLFLARFLDALLDSWRLSLPEPTPEAQRVPATWSVISGYERCPLIVDAI